RSGAVSGHAGDAGRAFDYHRAPGLLGQVHSCRRRDPHTSMAGIRLRPQYAPDIRGLAAASRLRFDIRTERLAGLDSGPRNEPPAFAPVPGTWGGPLLQLSSTGGQALGGRARRPCASPEEHSAEVLLRRAGLPPVRSDLRAARVLPDAHRDGDPARQHRGNRAVRRARGAADRVRHRRANADAYPDPGAAAAVVRYDRTRNG